MEQTNFDMKTSNSRHGSSYTVEVFMHVLAWLFVCASPLIFNHGRAHIYFKDYVRGGFKPMMWRYKKDRKTEKKKKKKTKNNKKKKKTKKNRQFHS